MLAIFSALILEVPLATSARRNNTFSRACPGVVKRAWYRDVRCKQQRAVTNFLWAEKQLVTNNQKHSKMCTVSVLFIKELLVAKLHELQVLTNSTDETGGEAGKNPRGLPVQKVGRSL
jgi:hypothetical protein